MPLLILLIGLPVSVEAQVLKGFGKKLENKLEQRIERKTDRQVEKVLDKADKKTDEPIDNALHKPKGKPDAKASKTEGKKQPKQASVFQEVVADPAQSLTLIGANCNDFSWFKKGAVLEYEVLDNKGKLEGETRMEVLSLRSEGSAMISQVSASMNMPHSGSIAYQMNYVCDGDKLYMDIGAMMKAMVDNNPEIRQQNQELQEALSNMEINFENGFASFPKHMYPGMKLDDLYFSFKTKSGSSEMVFQTQVTERQVVAKENVTTKAGTFECLKIRSVSHTTLNVMGVKRAMPASTEYLWVAPEVGMVRQETETGKEKGTSIQLKKYKR